MLQFREMTPADKQRADRILKRSPSRGTEGCFATLFIWKNRSNLMIDFYGEHVFFRGKGEDGNPFYLFPYGDGVTRDTIELVWNDARSLGAPLVFVGLTAETRDKLMRLCPNLFEVREERDNFDYLYLAEKMISLSGKKLHAKRNFINRFHQAYDGRWRFDRYTPDDYWPVRAYLKKWHSQNEIKADESLEDETCAVLTALKYLRELELSCGILRLDGEIIAFSIGTPITEDTFDVQIEKADNEIPGAYPMINQLFATEFCGGFTYMNREEDMGLEGLRKAKLSYYPEILLEKFTAWEK